MENKLLEEYTLEDLITVLNENVDAIIMVDAEIGKYRTIASNSVFEKFLGRTGEYRSLIEKLWFHLEDSKGEITDDYKAFIDYYGEFRGKYSRRLKIFLEGSDKPSIVQMNVHPVTGTDKYVFVLYVLDDEEYVEDFMTVRKVNTIQNTYLFSMYVDLIRDTTSSISVSEISKDTVKASIKYSEWRLMTVNMITPEEQDHFLKITDPEYLKVNLDPGQATSFDCLMKNLEGVYIWVKLIFSRAQTSNNDDFRFVFMVQNINDDVLERMETIKKYEKLVLIDPLTCLYNHGGIKTEIENAMDSYKKGGESVNLIMIDIDNFKNINDSYGHAIGDATLKTLADILKAYTKEENAVVGRWGGEEFVIVLKNESDDRAFSFSEGLRKTISEADFGKAGNITCSVGISHLNTEDSFEDFFERMDKAMYCSKKEGRNKVTLL